MVTAEEHEQVVIERDAWETVARERHATLEKLKTDRSAETIRAAGQLMRLAWVLMIGLVVFAGTIIVAGAIRASARECPSRTEQPQELPP